ncbi:unnamed protein product [Ectocarpus fasciculatus]
MRMRMNAKPHLESQWTESSPMALCIRNRLASPSTWYLEWAWDLLARYYCHCYTYRRSGTFCYTFRQPDFTTYSSTMSVSMSSMACWNLARGAWTRLSLNWSAS